MTIPAFLVDFTPSIWLIPLGIAIKEGKKPRLYHLATLQVNEDSYPVNRIIDKAVEPDIVFSKAQTEHFNYLWRLRATYPAEIILQYSDDISGCFNQRQFHLDMTGANTSLFQNYLCFPVGMHFGGI